MGEQAPPQFSADGNYWWDGEQWLPVDHLPKQLSAWPESSLPPFSDQWTTRRPPAFVFLIAGLLGLLVLAAALAATGRLPIPVLSSRPPPARTTPLPTASPRPSPTRTLLPGVTTQAVLPIAKQQGLTCQGMQADIPGVAELCEVSKQRTLRRIVVDGPSGQRIAHVRAVYEDDATRPDPAAAAGFLGAVAALPYPGADPAQATAWVRANVTNQSAAITIRGVTFRDRVEAKGHRLVLDIVPE